MGLWSFLGSWLGKFYSGVVVESISPTYYASGIYKLEFEVIGSGFDNLPVGIMATPSRENDNPLMYLKTTSPGAFMDLTERSDTRLVFSAPESYNHTVELYLGCICSAGRDVIYFVNSSNPLP